MRVPSANIQEISPAASAAPSGVIDELVADIWRYKRWVGLLALVGLIVGGVLSSFMTKIYEADLEMAPARTERGNSGLSGLTSQFGDLAAMFGVSLLAGDNGSSSLNIAYLKSRQFRADFITRHNLMPILYASRWDARAQRWRQDGKPLPTLEDAVRYFEKKVLTVKEDRKGTLVTVSVRWRDRTLAAQWANDLVADVNAQARQRAIAEAQSSLKYLTSEMEKTTIVGLREAIGRLMENNINSIMLANVRRDFAFEVVDPATVPDEPHFVSPVRSLDAAVGLVIGGGMGMLAALLLARRRRMNEDRELPSASSR